MVKAAPLFLVMLILFPHYAIGQLLNYPESVVYDSVANIYLVSNWNTGNLVQIDGNGAQSNFLTNAGCYAGLWLVGDEIYSASKGEGVKGYNIRSGEPVMDLSIPGTLLLNDIVADDSGYLYLSDPQAHKIIKVNMETHEWSNFVESGINVPNGMWFDRVNNRLILVSARYDSPIQAIGLADSSVTTIINTPIDIMDGIARDDAGYYYISAWGSSRVYKFDCLFTFPPEVFSTHGEQPADIFYDRYNSVLAVPVFFEHTVDFMPVEQTYVGNVDFILPASSELLPNYPNPFNMATNISFTLSETLPVKLEVYNSLGQQIILLIDETMSAGIYRLKWNADGLSSGVYYARLATDVNTSSIKMIVLK